MLTIVDYGTGNLGSIKNMLKKIGVPSAVTSSKKEIKKAEKLILPGVGAFDKGMKNLAELELIDTLCEKVIEDQTPILGICLGMQLLARNSEEGSMPGLGWIDAEIVRFKFKTQEKDLKVPHMGWNSVEMVHNSHIYDNMYTEPRFYFVHSYHMKCEDDSDVLTRTFYGYDFTSSVQHQNIIGVQFHPEKSHKFGMKILENFAGN